MMAGNDEATINIVVNARGVKVVQFCGEGWDDESEATRIYQLIKPLIREMDLTLKVPSTTVTQ